MSIDDTILLELCFNKSGGGRKIIYLWFSNGRIMLT